MARAAFILAVAAVLATAVMGNAVGLTTLWVTVGFALAGLHELTVRWTRR